jgi:hypothetical protein
MKASLRHFSTRSRRFPWLRNGLGEAKQEVFCLAQRLQ